MKSWSSPDNRCGDDPSMPDHRQVADWSRSARTLRFSRWSERRYNGKHRRLTKVGDMVPPDRGWTPFAERAGEWLTSWVDRLPPGLRRLLPKDLVGFAILGAFTFAIDLALLWFLRTHTALPIAVAVSAAYIVAFGLNFVLNRTVNFRSHAPVGSQALRYALVVG